MQIDLHDASKTFIGPYEIQDFRAYPSLVGVEEKDPSPKAEGSVTTRYFIRRGQNVGTDAHRYDESRLIMAVPSTEPPPDIPPHLTTDPSDPRLRKVTPSGQQETYLVLSEEERAKGFVRPVRTSYKHLPCGTVTTMGLAIAETYSRRPTFYTGTYCVHCGGHFPVGEAGEFVWEPDGTKVGS